MIDNFTQDSTTVHDKESEFHNRWALSTPLDQIAVLQAFESPAALENRAVLAMMGDLKGKRLLDVGAGLGESSVYFALKGAEVTAVDLSPEMVDCTVALGKVHGVKIEGIVQAGEDLDVPANSFDIAYAANTIHHVGDRAKLFQQIRAALKPGGRFFSIDPLAYNPVIEVYRRMATKVRTEDESPLRMRDVAVARKYFRNLRHHEFWLAGLVLFLKYYFIDRVHPNDDRYWKRILRETPESLWWWMPIRALDRVLTRIPGLRLLSWNIVMSGEKG